MDRQHLDSGQGIVGHFLYCCQLITGCEPTYTPLLLPVVVDITFQVMCCQEYGFA